MISDVHSYFFENGNTGYYILNISYKQDGVSKGFTLRTGVQDSYENFLLCTIDDILIGELTDKQQTYWEDFKNNDFFKELVITHDKLLLSELEYSLERNKEEFEIFLLNGVCNQHNVS